MPIITAGVPVVATVDGMKELTGQPVDTETRLYWEMSLDLGHATLAPISQIAWDMPGDVSQFTHRLISENGGCFHVRVEGGAHEWPALETPTAFLPLQEMMEAMERMKRQMQTLLAANKELEERLRDLER